MTNPSRDENELKLPPAWKKHLLPLRGKRPGKPVGLDTDAVKTVLDQSRRHDAELRRVLENPENMDYAEAGMAYLDDELNPRGAGVIAALICDIGSDVSSQPVLRPVLDAWVLDQGLPFAVCAAIERLTIYIRSKDQQQRPLGPGRQLIEPSVHSLSREIREGGVADLRSLLAAASDVEYGATVVAAGAHRGGPEQRLAAALLMPDQEQWVREACQDSQSHRNLGWMESILWHTVSEPEHLSIAGLASFGGYHPNALVAVLLDGVGAAGLPVLVETLERRGSKPEIRLLMYKAITLLPSDEAVSFLLGRLDDPTAFEPAAESADRFPERMLRSIARFAKTAEPESHSKLIGIAAKIDEGVRDRLNPDDRAAIEGLLGESGLVPDAAVEVLPRLLASPPWAASGIEKEIVIPGLTAPQIERVALTEDECASLGPVEGTDDDPKWGERGIRENGSAELHLLSDAAIEIARPHFENWNGDCWYPMERELDRILMRFGTAAIAPVVKAVKSNPNTAQHALPSVVSLEAARVAADWLVRVKTARETAVAWFERHPADAAVLLIPDALGKAKKRRRTAATALGHLAEVHGQALVLEAAASYRPETVAAIEALTAPDPLEPAGVAIPVLSAWVDPAVLPQVLLRSREFALPAESVRHLITVLALATPEYRYTGIDIAAEACDRTSLTRFSLALFERWLSVGAPAKDGWALTQLVHFADNETVRCLAPLVREWPGQGQHGRAVKGLEVLGVIGSEAALRAIHRIAEKAKFQALKEEAEIQIKAIASDLGLNAEQLADRLVPDFGLGEETTLLLDYGPRKFTVAFDEHLKPYVTDETGKSRKSLPKPGAKDDAELAQAAYQRFSALKKELRTVAADQVQRLEAAMVNGREWTLAEFRLYFVDHPLTRHLARRLVWLARTGPDRAAFRIAEDGTFSGVEDDTLEIPENACIQVAHPIRLGSGQLERWAEVLADYEILQPFEQLGRTVMAFTDEELATGRLVRFEVAQVEIGHLLGLTQRGWHRTRVEDGGVEPGIYYPLPQGGYVTISLDPGIWVGLAGKSPVQTLQGVCLSDSETYWRPGDSDPGPTADIDPVTASEVLAGLSRITEVQSGS